MAFLQVPTARAAASASKTICLSTNGSTRNAAYRTCEAVIRTARRPCSVATTVVCTGTGVVEGGIRMPEYVALNSHAHRLSLHRPAAATPLRTLQLSSRHTSRTVSGELIQTPTRAEGSDFGMQLCRCNARLQEFQTRRLNFPYLPPPW